MSLDDALREAVRDEVRAALDDWQPPARPMTYSVAEVANLVGTSSETIYTEVHSGRLAHLAIDARGFRIPAIELDRWLTERTAASETAGLRSAS